MAARAVPDIETNGFDPEVNAGTSFKVIGPLSDSYPGVNTSHLLFSHEC
jgi:hypothetical protein